jgi:hypothetical protein
MHSQDDLLYISSDLNLGLSPKRKGEEEGLSDNPKSGRKKCSNLHRVQPMSMVVLNFGCAILW